MPRFLPCPQLDLFNKPDAKEKPRPYRGYRPRHKPAGSVYDLQSFFDTINRTVFEGELEKCILRWSRNRWSVTLGVCDVEARVITVNSALDDARVPEVVVAGVVHHEMLHLHFGISEGKNGRQKLHPPEFRIAERSFPGYKVAEKWLEDHWPLRGRPAKKPRPIEASFLTYLDLMKE